MKKIFAGFLTVLFVLSFIACGSGSANKSGTTEPLNLTGNWVQENAGETPYQAGYISGERIEIFWISDGGKTASLYWSGSYAAPTSNDNSYTWTSKNDTSRTGSALLASGNDKKEFTYKDGKISYLSSAMGSTTTVTLVRTDEDYQHFGDTVS